MICDLSAQNEDVNWLIKGDALYKAGQFENAVACYQKASEMGNAEAEFNLGYAYYNGEGINKDYASSAMWFKRSANQNFPKAQYNLAYCYMNGRGVPCDYDKAIDYLTKSANNGYKQAQITLSDCYAHGVLVEQNDEESRKWHELSMKDEKLTEVQKRATNNQVLKSQTVQVEQTKTQEQSLVQQTLTPDKNNSNLDPSSGTIDVDMSGGLSSNSHTSTVAKTNSNTSKQLNKQQSSNNANQNIGWKGVAEDNKIQLTKANSSFLSINEHGGLVLKAKSKKTTETKHNDASIATSDLSEKAAAVQQSAENMPEDKPFIANTTSSDITLSPPVIKILYPEDQFMFHTDNIKLKYQLIAPGQEEKTQITVMIDGQKIPSTRSVRSANTIDVDLPNHDCNVMMYAQNENGNSEPASIRLIRENVPTELPRLFAVAIGVGDYNDLKLPKLKYTCKDAQDFAKAVASKKGLPFSDVQVKVLCDSEAKRADIFEAMDWLKQEASPNDVCIFFYAGHGFRDEKDKFYFMPYGSNTDRLYDCFSSSDFRGEVEDVNCKMVVFVDACYSAALLEGNRSASASHFIEQLRRTKNGMVMYASSSSDTKSKEDENWQNGAFTKALIEAFNGAARKEGDEGLSTQDLDGFLYKEVRKITDYKQTPIFINPDGMEHFNIFIYDK